MGKPHQRLRLDQPAICQIRVQGALGESWLAWFDGMSITTEEDVTTLNGVIPDQPALHGLLIKIRNLRLPLLSLECVAKEE